MLLTFFLDLKKKVSNKIKHTPIPANNKYTNLLESTSLSRYLSCKISVQFRGG